MTPRLEPPPDAATPDVGEPDDPLHGLGRQAAWQFAALLLPGLYSVLLVAYLLHGLGPAGYAPWAAATAIVGWLALLDAGLSSTTTRDAARATAGDTEAVRRVHAANAAYGLLALAAIGLGSAGSLAIPVLLRLEGPAAVEAWLVGVLLALDLGIVVATAGWLGVARGARRFDIVLAANAIQVAIAAGVLVVLVPRIGLLGAAAAQPLARVGARAVLAGLLHSRVGWFRATPTHPGWARLRPLFAFSLPILAMQAAVQIGMGSDVIIVGAAAGATSVGLYAAGSQLVRYVGLLLFPALGVLLPAFSAMAYQRPAAIPESLRRALFLGGVIGAMVFGGIALQAREIVRLWSGQTAELSVTVMLLYALAWTLVTPAQIFVLMLVARGRHALIGGIILAEALANFALSIALVQRFGPVGVAVATLVAVAVDDILIIPAVAARRLEIALPPLLAAAAAGLAAGIVLIGLINLLPLGGTAGLVLRAAIGAAVLGLVLRVAMPAGRLPTFGRVHP